MSAKPLQPTAVIDWDVFDQLARETSQQTAVAFAATFIELLPHRLSMLANAVQTEHHEDALVALFSIQSGALMLGMLRLAAATETLLTELRVSPSRWAAVRGLAGTSLTSGLDEIVAVLDAGLTAQTQPGNQPGNQTKPTADAPGEEKQ